MMRLEKKPSWLLAVVSLRLNGVSGITRNLSPVAFILQKGSVQLLIRSCHTVIGVA